MNDINQSFAVKPRSSISQYFFDLDLIGTTTFGSKRILKRNLWVAGCYLSFTLGVFARQIFSFNQSNISADPSRVNYLTLLAAFAIGMAIFPFALRSIIKLVTWVFRVGPLSEWRSSFNIVHLMMSYSLGFFFNLIAQDIPLLISKIGLT